MSNLSLQLSEESLQFLLLGLHLLLRTAVDQVIEEETRLVWNEAKTPNFDQLSWEHVSIRPRVSQRLYICGVFLLQLLQGGSLCSCCWGRLLLGRGVSERAAVGTDRPPPPRLPHSHKHTCRCCLMECDMDNSLHRSHQYTQLQHWRVPDTHTDTGWHKCYAHTHAHLTTQRCVSSQALFPQMERAGLTDTHLNTNTQASQARGGLFSSTLPLRPNTNVHTRSIFLSTWLQLGAEQDKDLHRTSQNTDRWETSYTSRCPPAVLTHTNKHGRISDTRTMSTRESALTSRIFGEARVLVQQFRNLCDRQKTTVNHRQATSDLWVNITTKVVVLNWIWFHKTVVLYHHVIKFPQIFNPVV